MSTPAIALKSSPERCSGVPSPARAGNASNSMLASCVRCTLDGRARDRFNEATCIRVLRVTDHTLRRPLLDDLAKVENVNALGDLADDSEVVRDEEI